jgi:hypothetical protein
MEHYPGNPVASSGPARLQPPGPWQTKGELRMQDKSTPGIEPRHARKCRSRDGGRCNCSPTFQANAWDSRSRKLIRKTFPTKTAAKLWRQDATVALRAGTMVAPTPTTVAEALATLLAGMSDGSAMTRSGGRYRPATIRSYEQAIRVYIVPAIGGRRLHDVRRRDIQGFVDRLRADGLGASTIHNKLDRCA